MWQTLVEQAQGGDLTAFDKLMARYQDGVVAVALALLGDFEQARDAAQETFIQAWRDLAQLRDRAAFPAWLLGIARNRCRDLVRRPCLPLLPLEQAAETASPAREADPAEEVARRQARARVLQAIGELSEVNRVTTTLFYIDGYTVSEVAGFLEVPAGTVKRRLHEARRQLHGSVGDMLEETLHTGKPGPELRALVAEELRQRREQWDQWLLQWQAHDAAEPERNVQWAQRWHEQRLADVRANAAQYGLSPDLGLPRMLPEYRDRETFRDDLQEMPRRWGFPEGVEPVNLRDLARDLRVAPLELRRWEQEGLPVLRYRPWFAYDPARVGEWLDAHRPEVRSGNGRPEIERPLLTVLTDLASGAATAEEAADTYDALLTASLSSPDPLFAPRWAALREEQLRANAARYGLERPSDTWLGIPAEADTFEIRDLTRRLALSPLDVARWTRAGMPCLRLGGYVRYNLDWVGEWLAGQGIMPPRHGLAELDQTELFVCRAVACGEGAVDDAYEALSGWLAVM